MTKKRWILFIGGAAALVAASYIGTLRSYSAGEPFYRGKPASYWGRELPQWGESLWPSVSTNSTRKGLSGPTTWVRQQSNWERWVARHLPRLVPLLPKQPPIMDGDAAALPVLRALAEHEDVKVRRVAVAGLARLTGDEAIAALRKRLTDSDAPVRNRAEASLQAMGVSFSNGGVTR